MEHLEGEGEGGTEDNNNDITVQRQGFRAHAVDPLGNSNFRVERVRSEFNKFGDRHVVARERGHAIGNCSPSKSDEVNKRSCAHGCGNTGLP